MVTDAEWKLMERDRQERENLDPLWKLLNTVSAAQLNDVQLILLIIQNTYMYLWIVLAL